MGNLFVMFIGVIIVIAIIAFILPDSNKSRSKSAKDAVKNEFSWILFLFGAAAVIGVLFTIGGALF